MQPAEEPPFIYLNNAATSWPKPPAVIAEVNRALQAPFFEHGRSTSAAAIDYPTETRNRLATFFNVDTPEHIVFASSATDALNTLIHGFARNAGEPFHAITTELEHNSVLRPLHALKDAGALSLDIVPFTKDRVSLAAIKKAVCPETRLVVMTHGSNVLGSVNDIKPIAEYLLANEIFLIVDGAQTAGLIPVDLTDIPADAFVFTGHKALFGIPGIGGFCLREPEKIAVTRQGGTGTESKIVAHPQEMPARFEAGTPNYPGIASLSAGIRFIEEIGLGAIQEHGNRITKAFISELERSDVIEIYNRSPDLPVVSFNISHLDNDEAGYILARAYHIITRTGLHCAPLVHERIDGGKGSIRASFSWFTTMDECRQAAEAIREVAGSCAS
jgi:cysteine desulfurase family protein